MHTIIGAGGAEGALDASNILKPAMARGEIQIIGATTITEYRKYVEKDAALERRFQPITVEEPTAEETEQILEGLKGRYEEHHKVIISREAITAAVELSQRYITDRFLPDKAIDLMDEAAASLRLAAVKAPGNILEMEHEEKTLADEFEQALIHDDLEQASELRKEKEAIQKKIASQRKRYARNQEKKQLVLSAEDVAHVVSQWTKIPVDRLNEKEAARLRNLEKILHKRVIGQDEAVEAVCRAVRRGRVGLEGTRQAHRFLFVSRPHRCWKDRNFQGVGGGSVWHRGCDDPCGHDRIYGKAQRIQDDRVASRICGI